MAEGSRFVVTDWMEDMPEYVQFTTPLATHVMKREDANYILALEAERDSLRVEEAAWEEERARLTAERDEALRRKRVGNEFTHRQQERLRDLEAERDSLLAALRQRLERYERLGEDVAIVLEAAQPWSAALQAWRNRDQA